MAWDYAELSKAAKEVGGPEKLMDVLVESGKRTGHKEMAPLVVGALLVGTGATLGIQKLIDFFREKSATSDKAVEEAKKELIKGIKEYDALHISEQCKDVDQDTEL